MKLGTAAVLAATMLPLAVPAQADVHQNGTALLNDCKAGNQTCYAYILGVYDGAGITGGVANHPLICANNVNGNLLRDVYVKWASANPGIAASDERGTAAMVAMAKAFPCH